MKHSLQYLQPHLDLINPDFTASMRFGRHQEQQSQSSQFHFLQQQLLHKPQSKRHTRLDFQSLGRIDPRRK
jgi:hypothetical protein